MDSLKRWQIYNYNKKELKKIISSKFKVWRWSNTTRLTIEGTSEYMTFFYLKYNNIEAVESPFPNPYGNPLAKRIDYEG
jgi:hypothetical protein